MTHCTTYFSDIPPSSIRPPTGGFLLELILIQNKLQEELSLSALVRYVCATSLVHLSYVLEWCQRFLPEPIWRVSSDARNLFAVLPTSQCDLSLELAICEKHWKLEFYGSRMPEFWRFHFRARRFNDVTRQHSMAAYVTLLPAVLSTWIEVNTYFEAPNSEWKRFRRSA